MLDVECLILNRVWVENQEGWEFWILDADEGLLWRHKALSLKNQNSTFKIISSTFSLQSER